MMGRWIAGTLLILGAIGLLLTLGMPWMSIVDNSGGATTYTFMDGLNGRFVWSIAVPLWVLIASGVVGTVLCLVRLWGGAVPDTAYLGLLVFAVLHIFLFRVKCQRTPDAFLEPGSVIALGCSVVILLVAICIARWKKPDSDP